MVQQPLNRAQAAPGQAILDLFDLLGDMDVNRSVPGQRHDCGQFIRRDGTQRMRRNAERGPLICSDGLPRSFQQPAKLIDGVDEAPLPAIGSPAAET